MAENPNPIVRSKGNTLKIDYSELEIDIEHLAPDVRAEIQRYAAMKGVDFLQTVAALKRDLHATSASMLTVAEVVRKMSESGDSVTVEQTINNSAGTIKVKAGNTEEAKKGLGGGNIPWQYVIGGIALAIVVAAILSNN